MLRSLVFVPVGVILMKTTVWFHLIVSFESKTKNIHAGEASGMDFPFTGNPKGVQEPKKAHHRRKLTFIDRFLQVFRPKFKNK